jgi:hypothetical protein
VRYRGGFAGKVGVGCLARRVVAVSRGIGALRIGGPEAETLELQASAAGWSAEALRLTEADDANALLRRRRA